MNSKALSLLVVLGLVAPLGACGGEQVEEQAPTTAPAAEDEGGEGGEDGAPTPTTTPNNEDEGGEGGEDGGDEASEKQDEDEGGEGGEG
jgi:hypothetical protein